jgi:hypothetical protein
MVGWERLVTHTGEIRNAYNILVRKSDEKRGLGRQRHGWEGIIEMYLKETGYKDVDWVQLVQDTVQWCALVNKSKR